ncbi:MAG: hypothetical protein E2P02_02820 [Acidobacteria bacterium]|nr:MAG: hypothetical protein E2P02_02820 [Acidobacteriota bacterium]
MKQEILVILGTDGRSQLSKSDRGALGLALSELKGSIVACTRAGDQDAARYAAAAGVEQFLEPRGLEDCAFDIALVGRGACSDARDAGDLLPAMLAERRGAALAYEVVDLRRRADGLEVVRDLGHGARDILLVQGPAVLVIADSVRRTGYVSRRRVLAAAPKGSESPDEASQIDWQRTQPRVRLSGHAAKVQGSATNRLNDLFGIAITGSRGKESNDSQLVTGSPETCARHLLRYLAHHDFIAPDRIPMPETSHRLEPPSEAVLAPARPRARPRRGPRRATDSDQGIARRPLPLKKTIESRVPQPVSGRRIARRGPYRLNERPEADAH